jgi:hypothetical protein
MKKLILVLIFSLNATAGNICEAEFLGLHNLTGKSELEHLKKIEKLETIRNKIRKLKEDPGTIAVDNHNYKLFQDVGKQLIKGRISLARDKWQPLFRRVERHYYYVVKKQEIVKDVLLVREESISGILAHLERRYKAEPFVLDILKHTRRKDIKSGDELISYMNKGIKKSAKYIGWKVSNYKFINDELDLMLKGRKCNEKCKKQIRLLRREIGVSAKVEQERFSMFSGLKKVKVKDLESLVNKIPKARETRLYKSILYELNKYLQEKVTQPKWRGVLADILYTVSFQWGWSARQIDSLLTEAINVSNHYFPINKVIMRTKTLADQVEKLKNQNSLFIEDALLLTFARRVDDLARGTWKEILAEVKKSDKDFYKRMVTAQNKAKNHRKPLSEDYEKSPHRLTAYLLAGGGTFAYLYLNFNTSDGGDGEIEAGVSIVSDGSLEDLGDVDLNAGDQVIEINSEEELDQTIELIDGIQSAILKNEL